MLGEAVSDIHDAAPRRGRGSRLLAGLNYLYLLGMLVVVAGILTAAMVMQYVKGELPCPLCLLQRVALFGIAYGIIQNFRGRFSYQNTGISLLFAILLLIVATRQTLLDIYPRPGHEYIGTAILGLHMPVWSVIIAAAIITAYALKLAVLGGDDHLIDHPAEDFPLLARLADFGAAYVIVICLINLGSVVVQCGFGECHTMGYKLIQNGLPGLWLK
jgi:disulfide bond formation protein DsbB